MTIKLLNSNIREGVLEARRSRAGDIKFCEKAEQYHLSILSLRALSAFKLLVGASLRVSNSSPKFNHLTVSSVRLSHFDVELLEVLLERKFFS
jgi:hypothetical protein